MLYIRIYIWYIHTYIWYIRMGTLWVPHSRSKFSTGSKNTKSLQHQDGMGGLVRTQHVCIIHTYDTYIHTYDTHVERRFDFRKHSQGFWLYAARTGGGAVCVCVWCVCVMCVCMYECMYWCEQTPAIVYVFPFCALTHGSVCVSYEA